jgi:hypothetical protein
VDWAGVEADYLEGLLSLRAIASKFGVSLGAVQKHAAAGKWVRGEQAQVHKAAARTAFVKAAKQEIAKAPVRPEVLERAMEIRTTVEVVEAYSVALVRVKREHRDDLQRFRRLAGKLFAELEEVTDSAESLHALPALLDKAGLVNPAELLGLRSAIRAATSLSGRAVTLEKLARTMDTMVRLEREIFGLDKLAPAIGEGDDLGAAPDRPIRFVAPDGSKHDSATTLVEHMPGLWAEVGGEDEDDGGPPVDGRRLQQ